MPLFFLIVGVMLVVVGINNKIGDLTALVKEDFKPTDGTIGFFYWVLAIILAGSVGYVRDLRPVANAFLVLIVVGLVLSNKGFVEKFTAAVKG